MNRILSGRDWPKADRPFIVERFFATPRMLAQSLKIGRVLDGGLKKPAAGLRAERWPSG
jgi:hypothetical protein